MGTGTVKVPVPRIFHFSGGIGTSIGKIWYRKKVSEPVSVKFGIGKKFRNRYRKNLVSEKSLGTGIRKIWYRKKYRYRYRKYLVPEKSIGIGIIQHFGYRHTLVYIPFGYRHTLVYIPFGDSLVSLKQSQQT